MKNIVENNLIRFTKISKNKEGMFAHFKAKGVKNGAAFTASMSVDFSAANVDLGDSLEQIIDECARVAKREYEKSNLQFEGIESI